MNDITQKIYAWLLCGGIAAVGCSSMGAGSTREENYCGNLLWQSSLTHVALISSWRVVGSGEVVNE